MARFTLKQGYDVPIAGDSNPEVVDGALATVASVRPADFIGIKPRLLVRDGDSVLAGTPLFHAKDDESQVFTSPISGTVSEVSGVVRGDRRVLLAVNIESDGKNEAVSFEPTSAAAIPGKSSEQLRETLVKSGQLALFRERPFGHVARAKHTPRDIFVSAIAFVTRWCFPDVLAFGFAILFPTSFDALIFEYLNSTPITLGIFKAFVTDNDHSMRMHWQHVWSTVELDSPCRFGQFVDHCFIIEMTETCRKIEHIPTSHHKVIDDQWRWVSVEFEAFFSQF